MKLEQLDYMCPSAVAKILSVHPETIRNWIKSGILPALQVEGVTRILRSDVEDLIRTRTTAKRA